MALAKCRECRRRVSTEAAACPHCGCPAPVLVLTSGAAESDQSVQVPDTPAEPHVPPQPSENAQDDFPLDAEHCEPTRPPSLPFPRVWVGFLFVGVRVIVDGYIASHNHTADLDSQQRMVTATIAFAGFIYWLYCVYALHVVVAIETGFQHPITPNMSVVGHVVPGYNVYWLFRWPSAIADFVEQRP